MAHSEGMAKEGPAALAREYWRGWVAEQERTNQPVRAFCRERRIGEHSFYLWRRRLREAACLEPVRFALVERRAGAVAEPNAGDPGSGD